MQHLSYEGQLVQKQKTVRDVMDRIGKTPSCTRPSSKRDGRPLALPQ